MSEQTAVTPVERAKVALGVAEYEKRFIELARKSVDIVSITNADGYAQCHAARMVLKRERVDVEKLAKNASEDAFRFYKATIAEGKRLIEIIEPEEKRLEAIQNAWDDAIEAERQAKIQAEIKRTTAIALAIDNIRSLAISAVNKPTEEIYFVFLGLSDDPISADSYQEFQSEAQRVKKETLSSLEEIHFNKCLQEIEQDRIKAERAELERLRAEQKAREAEEQKKRAAENARIDAERKAEEAKRKAERDAEEARIAAIRKAEQAERDAEERRLNEERFKLSLEREAIETEKRVQARIAQEAKEAEERKQREQEAKRLEEEAAAKAKAERMAALKKAKVDSAELALINILEIARHLETGMYEGPYLSKKVAQIILICEANLEKVAA